MFQGGNMKEEKSRILTVSSTYLKLISQMVNGQKVIERHVAMEEIFGWPHLIDDVPKIVASLKQERIEAHKVAVSRDLELYAIIAESLEYGVSGRKNYLDEEKKVHQDKVPVLGCTFKVLAKIILEIDRALRSSTPKSDAPQPEPPEPPAPPEKAIVKAKGGKKDYQEEIKRLTTELADVKKVAGQQALELLRVNREMAHQAQEIVRLGQEKEDLSSQLTKKDKEMVRLVQQKSELQEEVENLNAQWDDNVGLFERIKKAITFFQELESWHAELKQLLEEVEDSDQKGKTDQAGEDEKEIDVIGRMPKAMETNGQKIERGSGFEDSLKPLSYGEKSELLTALIMFGKIGGGHRNFNTVTFTGDTKFSKRGCNITFMADGKIGFTWTGGDKKQGRPTIFHEAVRFTG